MLECLGRLYVASDLGAPGDTPPEVIDAEFDAIERAAPRRGRPPFLLSHDERVAVEKRAVDLMCEALRAEGWEVKDVGAHKPHDLEARKDEVELWVEVKGTTSTGNEVVLTNGEVIEYSAKWPDTMLALVSGISLDRTSHPAVATGGSLRTVSQWGIDPAALTPISFRYRVFDVAIKNDPKVRDR